MAVKATTWRIRGMNRDTDPLVFSNEFAYENRNIRITASSDSTLLGITNIKGTSKIQNVKLLGTPIGTATISNYLVLFTTIYKEEAANPAPNENYPDTIYRIKFTGDEVEADIIAHGNFNFSTLNPIETIPYWEAEDVINIYWTDGRNQIRKINIVDSGIFSEDGNVTPIDSVDELDFITSFDSAPIKNVTIEKQYSVGSFPSGVIQYFITAYNKFGNETNILYESPLYYMSPSDRGGTAEESNVNSFKLSIEVSNELDDFDYLRVYSTHRTSLNADVAAYRVSDIQLHGAGTYTIVDTGHGLESIDPTSLLYKEREPFSAGTFAQKDNVLFIGDVKLLGEDSEDFIALRNWFQSNALDYEEKSEEIDYYAPTGVYPYDSNLDESNLDLKGFKCHDYYKIGIQFQRKTGEWTSVIPLHFNSPDGEIVDYIKTTKYPSINYSTYKVNVPKISINIGPSTIRIDENYIAMRAVIAEPILGHKSIRCQGILCPTLYNIQDRKDNNPYSIASWFIRPCGVSGVDTFLHNNELPPSFTIGSMYQDTQLIDGWDGQVYFNSLGVEIQNAWHTSAYKRFPVEPYTQDFVDWQEQSPNYIVDQNILTFHSPDMDSDNAPSFNGDYKVRIVGMVPITSNYADFFLQTSSGKLSTFGTGKRTYDGIAENLEGLSNRLNTLYSAYLWNDAVRRNSNGNYTNNTYKFLTYSWHRNGSLNNDRNMDGADVGQSALLSHKIFSNLKYSYFTSYFKNVSLDTQASDGVDLSPNLVHLNPFNSNEAEAIRVGDNIYMGNVDKVASWVPFNMDFMNTTEQFRTSTFKRLVDGYPIILWNQNESDLTKRLNSVSDALGGSVDDLYEVGIEPVSIKFKSTPHLVFQLPQDGLRKTVLPSIHSPFYINDYSVSDSSASIMRISIEDWDNSTKRYCTFWSEGVPSKDGTYFIYTSSSTGAPPTVGHFAVVSGGSINHNPQLNVDVGTIVVDNSYRYAVKVDSITNVGSELYYVHDITPNDYISQSALRINSSQSASGEYGVTIDDWEYDNMLSSSSLMGPFLYMAEVYEDIDADDIYGTNYENLRWNVASRAVPISSGSSTYNLLISGDTYFQRWDCMKTYPFTNEDQNSIVEIVSFMVETQNNIAARTDRNRGKQDNTTMSPTNFNLYNSVYNQSQDLISNVYLEDSDLVNSNFPNTIYWSLSKTLREEIDTWAAMTMSNSLDMDGDKGRVNAIRKYNNNLLVFQDTGLAQVLYNENMQIASTTGVPIEIANSGLVSGKRYISNTIGCENKWTIVTGENSLYFMDSFNKGIYKFDNQLTNLTSSLGFNSWADNVKIGKWLPESESGNIFLAGYDKQNKEVHFMNSNESLVYSEQLGLFMSFMDIERTPLISNVEDRVIAINKDAKDMDSYGLYTLNTGNYSTFFGESYPFYTQVVANPEPTLDKIFNVLEFRADCLDTDYKATSDMPFNKFRIWNEYQDSSDISLQLKNGRPSNLKKKFRIWRVNNFRNGNNRDRIRNPWAFFRLTNDEKKNVKVTLHDMVMHYFE